MDMPYKVESKLRFEVWCLAVLVYSDENFITLKVADPEIFCGSFGLQMGTLNEAVERMLEKVYSSLPQKSP